MAYPFRVYVQADVGPHATVNRKFTVVGLARPMPKTKLKLKTLMILGSLVWPLDS